MRKMINKMGEPHQKEILTKGWTTSELFLALVYLLINIFSNNISISIGGALVVVAYIISRMIVKRDINTTHVSHINIDRTV